MKQILVAALLLVLAGVCPAGLWAQTLALDYSTYLGGQGGLNYAWGVAVDANCCAYVTGETDSSIFPAVNGFQPSLAGGRDAYVAKFSSSGSTLVYSTFLGGGFYDYGLAIAVDGQKNAYVVGATESTSFPTRSAYQATFGGGYQDAFAAKIASSGSALLFSTYLGGRADDEAAGVALDSSGSFYCSGWTKSTGQFPVVGPYQSTNNGLSDIFVARFSSSGSTLLYATYLGGVLTDDARGIEVDADGGAYLAGYTGSSDFPTRNAYQSSFSGFYDAVAAKLSSSGSALVFSTFLGGGKRDEGFALDVDSQGCSYLAGLTGSIDFPTLNPFQAVNWNADTVYDSFVCKISSSGSSLVYSTYLGGTQSEVASGITVARTLCAYLTGNTQSSDFPTRHPCQASFAGGSHDGFAAKLSASGSVLIYSTYLGGNDTDEGTAAAVDWLFGLYLAGRTYSSDFPTVNSYQATFGGSCDAFVAKLGFEAPASKFHTDFDGDGSSDVAVFRPSDGLWSVRGMTRIYFGSSGDVPVPGDYTADGVTDFAVFRPEEGQWALKDLSRVYFGQSGDVPIPADYNGDGTWDVGIFRPASGLWSLKDISRFYLGSAGDLPLPGYYTGSASADPAIFRESNGLWVARDVTRFYFGANGDDPVPAKYYLSWEYRIPAVFRPSQGRWAIREVTSIYFGQSGDTPVPADFGGGGADDIAVFRPSDGLWALREGTRIYFGQSGDIPVTR